MQTLNLAIDHVYQPIRDNNSVDTELIYKFFREWLRNWLLVLNFAEVHLTSTKEHVKGNFPISLYALTSFHLFFATSKSQVPSIGVSLLLLPPVTSS